MLELRITCAFTITNKLATQIYIICPLARTKMQYIKIQIQLKVIYNHNFVKLGHSKGILS